MTEGSAPRAGRTGGGGIWSEVLYPILFLAGMFLFCAYLARLLFFRTQMRDGDSWGNRLAGHGPNDEVAYQSPRERVAALWARRGARSKQHDDLSVGSADDD